MAASSCTIGVAGGGGGGGGGTTAGGGGGVGAGGGGGTTGTCGVWKLPPVDMLVPLALVATTR